MTRLYDGTILRGTTHLRGCCGPLKTGDVFQHIHDSLKGNQDSLI